MYVIGLNLVIIWFQTSTSGGAVVNTIVNIRGPQRLAHFMIFGLSGRGCAYWCYLFTLSDCIGYMPLTEVRLDSEK
jgi:hypothetical protein